jgi:hypothetical protein
MAAELTELLARPTWDHLDARLRDAVARNPSIAPLTEAIRAPVRTLDLLWRDAVPALRGDPLAAERLSVTLQAASADAALIAVAAAALASAPSNAADHKTGLVHLRALAIVIAAAFRTQPRAQAFFSMAVIGGLALRCGPAELLARLEPYGASAESYDNLVRLSVPPIVAAGVASRVHLRGHARDPVELARWRCIFEVLEHFEGQPSPDSEEPVEGDPSPGDGPIPVPRATRPSSRRAAARRAAAQPPVAQPPAPPSAAAAAAAAASGSTEIAHADGIEEVRVAEDGKVEILGSFRLLLTGQPPRLDPTRHAVVGVTASQQVLFGSEIEAELERIRVRFSSEVAWVGFVDRSRVKRANALRTSVRGVLSAVSDIPCTSREPRLDPQALLPDFPQELWPIAEAPPRTPSNQVPATTPTAPDEDDLGQRRDRITIVAVRVAAVEGPEPPSPAELVRLVQTVGQRLGIGIDIVTLPWIEDTAAVVSSPPRGDDDPRVAGVLEALARAAARTRGREAALWIAIVPGDAPVAVASRADAAAGIGVATSAGLHCCIARLLQPVQPVASQPMPTHMAAGRFTLPACSALERSPSAERVRPSTSRLRLVGRIAGASLELLEPPREEHRAAGSGAPEDIGLVAVALDHSGAELVRAPIRGHRTSGPAAFAALIPVSPEVDVVELRLGHVALSRIERTPRKPTPAQLTLDMEADAVVATWTTPQSARPVALVVEVARGDGDGPNDWVPIAELHACANRALLPLWRIPRVSRIRLVACDGWNATAGAAAFVPQPARFGPVAIRRVNERMLWAELPDEVDGAWSVTVDHTEHGRRLDLASSAGGEVRLSAGELGQEGSTLLVDFLQLERRDVYRRP